MCNFNWCTVPHHMYNVCYDCIKCMSLSCMLDLSTQNWLICRCLMIMSLENSILIQSTYHNDIQCQLIRTIRQQHLSVCPEWCIRVHITLFVKMHSVVRNCYFHHQYFKINISVTFWYYWWYFQYYWENIRNCCTSLLFDMVQVYCFYHIMCFWTQYIKQWYSVFLFWSWANVIPVEMMYAAKRVILLMSTADCFDCLCLLVFAASAGGSVPLKPIK